MRVEKRILGADIVMCLSAYKITPQGESGNHIRERLTTIKEHAKWPSCKPRGVKTRILHLSRETSVLLTSNGSEAPDIGPSLRAIGFQDIACDGIICGVCLL
jgi:hypothetical protein